MPKQRRASRPRLAVSVQHKTIGSGCPPTRTPGFQPSRPGGFGRTPRNRRQRRGTKPSSPVRIRLKARPTSRSKTARHTPPATNAAAPRPIAWPAPECQTRDRPLDPFFLIMVPTFLDERSISPPPPASPGRAKQDQRRGAAVHVHRHRPAAAGADDHIRLAPVVLGLGDADGSVEILVRQGRVQDLMAVVLEARRFEAAWRELPAVKEQDSHSSHPRKQNSIPRHSRKRATTPTTRLVPTNKKRVPRSIPPHAGVHDSSCPRWSSRFIVSLRFSSNDRSRERRRLETGGDDAHDKS